MVYTRKIANLQLLFSVLALIYFTLINYWYYYPPKSTDIIRFFGEFLTIPLLLVVIFNLISSIFFAIKKKFITKNVIIFLLGSLSMVLLFL